MQSLLPGSVLARTAPALTPGSDAIAPTAPPTWIHKLADELRGLAARQREGQVAQLDGRYLRLQAQGELNQALQDSVTRARESGLPFLRRLEGGVNIDVESGRSALELNAIEEVHRAGKRSVLAQVGAHNENDRPTASAGLVYRHDTAAGWLLGTNAFVDREFGKQHWRASVGMEAIAPEFTLLGNVYLPLSGWRGSRHEERLQERPASGFDLGLSYRPEAWRGLSLTASYFRWNGAQVDVFDSGRGRYRPAGFKYGLQYRPVPMLSVGLEQTQVSGGQRQLRLQLGLSIRLGQPWAKQWRPEAAPPIEPSLDRQRSALVRRETRIVLKTRRKEIMLPLSAHPIITDAVDGRLTVAGLTQAFATVSLRMPDGSVGTTRADAAGRFRYTSARDQPSGNVLLRAVNIYGDTSVELNLVYVDEVVLGKLNVALLALAPQPADRALALSGKTQPSMEVVAHFPNSESVSAKSDGKGLFRVRSRRAVGQGQVVVRAIDPQTRQEARTAAHYQPPVAVAPTIDTVDTDAATGQVTVQGQAEPGSDVELIFPDGSRQRVRASAEGRYRLTSAADVPSGQLRALRVPRSGEAEAASLYTYVDVSDKTPPGAPEFASVLTAADTGRVSITGRAEPGSDVDVLFTDGSHQRVHAGKDGAFQAVSHQDIPAGPIVARATDAAGNVGPQASYDYTDGVDKTAPRTPTIDVMEAAQDSGRVTVKGAAEPGAWVQVTFPDGSRQRVQADSQGAYHTTSDHDVESGTIVAVAVDAAGNSSQQARQVYVDLVDRTAPGLPVIDRVQARQDNGVVTVEGTSEPGALLSVSFPGGEVKQVRAQADGRYRVTSSDHIEAGAIRVEAEDEAGNRSPAAIHSYVDTVDRRAPDAPSILAAQADPATGRVTLTGNAEPGAAVTVRWPDGTVSKAVAGPDGSYAVTSDRDQPAGEIMVSVTDAAGNQSSAMHQAYVDHVDATAPAAPTVSSATADAHTGRVTVQGLAEAGSTVTVRWPDGTRTTTTAGADGRYTAMSERDLASGDIVLEANDAAGNTSGSARHVYTDDVDATPPAAPSIDSALADSRTGRVTVSGAAESGASVTVHFPDGTTVQAKADANGRYTATSNGDIGSGQITAQASDDAGNSSSATPHTYRDMVDATPPAAPVISALTTDSQTGRVTVTGQAEAAAMVTVVFSDGSRQTVTAGPDGRFEAQSAKDIPTGAISVMAADAAGNQGPQALRQYMDEADKTAPALPSIDGLDTNDSNGHVTVRGKAEPLAWIDVTFPGGSKKTAQADGQGRYRVTSDKDIGTGEVLVVARDDAGNMSLPAKQQYRDSWSGKLPPSAVLFELSSRQNLSITKSAISGGRLWMLYLDPKYAGKVQVDVQPTNVTNGHAAVVAQYVKRNIEKTLRYDRIKRRNVYAIGFHDQTSGNKSVNKVPAGRYPNLLELRVTVPGEGVYRMTLNVQVHD
ncbi:bacterial Ig-like domain family protein [Bordetella holmesii 30539]|uniref:PF11924 family protein n=2 Tax=Bordetella holmesii TaxID=35814 RepID=A0A158M3Y2_9BORD|nr:bacterial Ig-like domain family protein [Bordetella holmesii 35009]EWM42374.1 bacterial Ig-like domain family protein [Bordetella holmesii 41130]EWM45202.1 bacterial Ig-like domain family protein [Bordetella holmesii 70147]EXF88508.1 bacterial Ig-like domain family protein [Bordetella holmesii 30539]EXX94511.1 bacterial Ig-like domain family protein [Bordetella holmesii 1058]KAK79349.1 PF11924 family protein [Bordetella holmesii H620]KAK80064.1 PF11924 family protein [Bordetella holmesii C